LDTDDQPCHPIRATSDHDIPRRRVLDLYHPTGAGEDYGDRWSSEGITRSNRVKVMLDQHSESC